MRGATSCVREDHEGHHIVCVRGPRGALHCVHEDNEGCYTMYVRTTKYFGFLLHHLCSSSIYLVTLFFPFRVLNAFENESKYYLLRKGEKGK